MKPSVLRHFSLGLATMLAAGVGIVPVALAQTRTVVRGLEENQGLIRQCRQLNQTVEVYDNTSLGPVANRLGTLPTGTQVILTGVVVQGRAQVFLPHNFNGLSPSQPVGWISAAFLTTCSGGQPPNRRACFRANLPLQVRTAPSTNASILANFNAADTIYATTNPPTRQTTSDGFTWMQVRIFNGSVGWVTETTNYGQIQDITAIPCP
jgi:hypothetical protein